MDAMPTGFLNDPVFRRLGKVARVAAFDKKERREYEQSLKTYRDAYAIFTTERREGFAEGKAEGMADLFRRMIANGTSVAEIAKLTGYSSAEIDNYLHLLQR